MLSLVNPRRNYQSTSIEFYVLSCNSNIIFNFVIQVFESFRHVLFYAIRHLKAQRCSYLHCILDKKLREDNRYVVSSLNTFAKQQDIEFDQMGLFQGKSD
jgi:hypothetical protein